MAKKGTLQPTGSSRIRFVMVDAEISNGDLSQVTQAIQNALKPSEGSSVRRLNGPQLARHHEAAEIVDIEEPAIDGQDMPEDAAPIAPDGSSPPARTPRKPKTPKVLALDLTTAPSLEEFAASRETNSDRRRFLTILAWLQQHRKVDAATADHVYTCYRALKWPASIKDFGQPLRDLKRDQLVESVAKGAYAINHLGLAEIE